MMYSKAVKLFTKAIPLKVGSILNLSILTIQRLSLCERSDVQILSIFISYQTREF